MWVCVHVSMLACACGCGVSYVYVGVGAYWCISVFMCASGCLFVLECMCVHMSMCACVCACERVGGFVCV